MGSPIRSLPESNRVMSQAALLTLDPCEGQATAAMPSIVSLGVVPPRRPLVAFLQRLCDVLCATLLLLFLLPLYLLIAATIKADSAGPVLFTQNRVGKDGVEFPCFKFRSMVADAERQRPALFLLT